MKRLKAVIATAAALLCALATPTVTMAADDDHRQTFFSMKKTFEAATMAAKRLPTFEDDGAVVQRHRAAPGDLDYDSFGYWLNAAPRPNARPPIGAWAAGPVEWKAPELPVTGAAKYEGTSKGYFALQIKSSPIPALENTRFEGEYTAPIVLLASFGTRSKPGGVVLPTIQGWMGHDLGGDESGIKVTGRLVDRNGVEGPFTAHFLQGKVDLLAKLKSDGTWRSDDVELSLGKGGFGLGGGDVTKTGGAWGGRLVAGDEFPASAIGEKAIGTVGARTTMDDGSKAVLLGAFGTGPGEPMTVTTYHFGDDGRVTVTCTTITGPC